MLVSLQRLSSVPGPHQGAGDAVFGQVQRLHAVLPQQVLESAHTSAQELSVHDVRGLVAYDTRREHQAGPRQVGDGVHFVSVW